VKRSGVSKMFGKTGKETSALKRKLICTRIEVLVENEIIVQRYN
jgi:hypothetical protein